MREPVEVTIQIDPKHMAFRDRGDSPYVTFPMRCPEGGVDCALPLGHLCEHISIDDAWEQEGKR